jgi:hypothetical protein
MLTTTARRACWRHGAKSARNAPIPLHHPAPPIVEESFTAQEIAEIERVLEQMANGESAMGCDYPDGPMSPNGCQW